MPMYLVLLSHIIYIYIYYILLSIKKGTVKFCIGNNMDGPREYCLEITDKEKL